MPNPIPERQRLAVKQRERFMCLRCCGKGSDWHHRRRRGVQDEHTHCTCNGVWLCFRCHRWCHANPGMAKQSGFILSSYIEFPGEHPVINSFGQQVVLTCDGKYKEATNDLPADAGEVS